MSLLTTAQLTFCDLKDSYTIHMDTECVGVACDVSGKALQTEDIIVNYRVLTGTDRVTASCEVLSLPSGVTVKNTQDATDAIDGVIVLGIATGATLNNEHNGFTYLSYAVYDITNQTWLQWLMILRYLPDK